MNASNVRTSSTPAAANASASLRPRANRLISGLSEGDETAFNAEHAPPRRIASPLPSPFDSRSASPIPAPHPQRTGSSQLLQGTSPSREGWLGRAQLGGQSRTRNESPSAFSGLWGNSWSTLQGLASEFLGGDLDVNKTSVRQRRTGSRLNGSRSNSIGSQGANWGPAPTSQPSIGIGVGTKEEREAAVRAEKRKNLLLRGDSSYGPQSAKYKRRLSDDHGTMSAPPGDQEDRSALVYLHHVKKDDTLAGITIKYNISANALRKANRMWPNDAVQSRTTIVLPVAACGVKGRPIPSEEAVDLLDSERIEEVETPKASIANGKAWHGRGDSTSTTTTTTGTRESTSVAAVSSVDNDPPWHHDSWVLLFGNSKPTEIARLSRRALGYFPPARRKSVSFSDLDSPPRSLDIARPIPGDIGDRMVGSPQRNSTSKRPRSSRRLSNADNGYYPSYLSGPGGVGTMNRNVHFPGPAQDGLNKMFAKYLTDVAPPRSPVNPQHSGLPMCSEQLTPVASGTSTPNSRGNHNLNLENVGGQIETWVRRVAAQAKQSVASSERKGGGPRTSVGAPGKGTGGIGDLIEMTDEFEIGGDDDDDGIEHERGRQGSAVFVGHQTTSSATDYSGGAVARDRARPSNSRIGKAN